MEKVNNSYENIVKQASSNKSIIFDFSKTYPAYIVLIVLLALSATVFYMTKQGVESDRKAEFDKSVNSVVSRIETQIQRNYQIVQSMQGLYKQNVQVVREYFELYGAVPAKTYTSIMSLAYVPKVLGENWETYHFYARSQGYYDYRLSPPGKRDLYYPIEHIVLFDANVNRLGFDYATDANAKEAIEKARDNNEFAATDAYMVRPDTLGFLLIAPIYNREALNNQNFDRIKDFQGALVLELNAVSFFETALTSDKKVISDTSLVFDFKSANGNTFLYKSKNYNLLETGYKPVVDGIVKIKIADREFVGHFYANPGFGGSFQAILPFLATAAAVILSFTFFGFIISVMTSRSRALDLAERMTRSQRRILESSKDLIGVLDFSGLWKSLNPASLPILGVDHNSIIGSSILDYFVEQSDEAKFKEMILNSGDETTHKYDVFINSKDNENKWINFSFTVSRTDNLIYCIGRDVTLEKIAEEEARIKSNQIELAGLFAKEASQSKSLFMTKLSHQLRNSLTGIIGYLQLLSNKIYDNEEEHDNYLQLAEQSSEEIFTFVSDIVDATNDTDESSIDNFVRLRVRNSIRNLSEKIKNIKVSIDAESEDSALVANAKLLNEGFDAIFNALTAGTLQGEVEIQAQENSYEGATEIQIMGSANSLVFQMIEIYKANSSNIIPALKYDKNDIILNFCKAASNFRRMNGTMTVETFGEDDSNVVMLTLPLSASKN